MDPTMDQEISSTPVPSMDPTMDLEISTTLLTSMDPTMDKEILTPLLSSMDLTMDQEVSTTLLPSMDPTVDQQMISEISMDPKTMPSILVDNKEISTLPLEDLNRDQTTPSETREVTSMDLNRIVA